MRTMHKSFLSIKSQDYFFGDREYMCRYNTLLIEYTEYAITRIGYPVSRIMKNGKNSEDSITIHNFD